jgi:hypothetical protein
MDLGYSRAGSQAPGPRLEKGQTCRCRSRRSTNTARWDPTGLLTIASRCAFWNRKRNQTGSFLRLALPRYPDLASLRWRCSASLAQSRYVSVADGWRRGSWGFVPYASLPFTYSRGLGGRRRGAPILVVGCCTAPIPLIPQVRIKPIKSSTHKKNLACGRRKPGFKCYFFLFRCWCDRLCESVSFPPVEEVQRIPKPRLCSESVQVSRFSHPSCLPSSRATPPQNEFARHPRW